MYILSSVAVFEGEEKMQHLAAQSERDRDAWIQALHIASYECLQMQVQSLREQIRSKTGQDPMTMADSLEPSASSRHGADMLAMSWEWVLMFGYNYEFC